MTAPAPAPFIDVSALTSADTYAQVLSTSERRRVGHISVFKTGPELGDMTIGSLAHLHNHPEHPLRAIVDAVCSKGCGAQFRCERWVAAVTACDECRAKHEEAEAMGRAKKHWEKICPKGFQDTDKNHAGFPKAQLAQLKEWIGGESLFFFGPTGSGKTRLALWMLKRAIVKNQWVGVLWPEKLRTLVQGYDNSTFDHYAAFGVLLMDDVLLTACRESKLVDAVKMLLDVRMRENRATIFTSQIGTEDEIAGGKEFGEAKSADLERIKAVVRRLRETCQVVGFGEAKVEQGEEAF